MNTRIPLTLIFIIVALAAFAQGGPGNRRSPAEMVAMEKQLVMDSISNLNSDQILIIDQIYKDYEVSLEKARANMNPDNREAMRESMTSIRNGKDEALQAILTEEQYQQYSKIMEARRKQMQGRRPQNND